MKIKSLKYFILTLLILSLFGCGSERISGDGEVGGAEDEKFSPGKIIKAETFLLTEEYEAVGSIRPKTETRIEAQIQAQVISVAATPGKRVKRGEILISLDDRRLKSKLNQAKEALKSAVSLENQARQEVAAAKASFNQADSDYKRVKKYFKSEAATKRELEQAESSYLRAKANLKRAKQGLEASRAGIRAAKQLVKEAEVGFGHTKITAPEDGEVLKRMVEPGDLALPGKPLLVIQTSGKLRLEAYLREGLISSAGIGEKVKVRLDTKDMELKGIIEEIVPYADPKTRTFLVKAAIPSIKGVYPGMYGKLLIPAHEKEIILIPREAIIRVGQLEMVNLKSSGKWIRVYVKTGAENEKGIEILSGIEKGDEIGIPK